jgi:hypothetical protein
MLLLKSECAVAHGRSVDAARRARRRGAGTCIHFHYAARVCHSRTRIHVRLLGPCFKTGRLTAFCQHPADRRVAACAFPRVASARPRSSARRPPSPITPRPEGRGYLCPGLFAHAKPMLTCPRPSARLCIAAAPLINRRHHCCQAFPF